jgi:putative transposase
MCSQSRSGYRHKSLRYARRDYSLPGKYFVTICTDMKIEWFGKVIDGKMHLSEIGRIASQMWYEIPVHFPFIGLDAFIVMPDHIHGIIVINKFIGSSTAGALHATPLPHHDTTHPANEIMSSISPKPGSLSVVVRSYKSAVTKHVHKLENSFSWQRGFHDNIICTTGQLSRIRKYILDNAQNRHKKI